MNFIEIICPILDCIQYLDFIFLFPRGSGPTEEGTLEAIVSVVVLLVHMRRSSAPPIS